MSLTSSRSSAPPIAPKRSPVPARSACFLDFGGCHPSIHLRVTTTTLPIRTVLCRTELRGHEMRKLIGGMQSSLDGKIEGPEGYADWVDAWSDHYDVMTRVDACLLGAGMYPGYEAYWTAVQNAPDEPLPQTGNVPTPGEVEYSRFAAQTPHYVLSTTLTSAQ